MAEFTPLERKKGGGQHNHTEAYCLMWYMCKKCGHKERIWNSRDGVTPFGLSCPSCGAPDLLHDAWNHDQYAPNHQIRLHQRFWRDGTYDDALAIARRRIGLMDGTQYQVPLGERETAAHRIASGHEFQKGWPMIDVYRGD